MAKLTKGIFGPISGKLGPVVGARWKKTAYLRSLPSKKKKRPRTEAQYANEQKFKFVAEWLIPFYPFVTIGFQNQAVNNTEINTAFSVNYKNATIGSYPALSINYKEVKLSEGSLAKLVGLELTLLSNNTIHLTWLRNNINHPCSYNDQLMLVLYNEELKIADGFIGGIKRADQQCTHVINLKLIGKPVHVYVVMYAVGGKKISQTQYLGEVGGV